MQVTHFVRSGGYFREKSEPQLAAGRLLGPDRALTSTSALLQSTTSTAPSPSLGSSGYPACAYSTGCISSTKWADQTRGNYFTRAGQGLTDLVCFAVVQ